MDQKKMEIALHECGHVVMALLCKREIEIVSLKEMDSPRGTDKYRGFTKLKPLNPNTKFTINDGIQRIMIAIGGFASEYLFFNSSKLRQDDLNIAVKTTEDMLQLEDFKNWIAQELTVPAPDVLVMIENPLVRAYIDHKIQECVRILEPHKPVIQLIATELYKREELTGDDVCALFS